MSSLQSLLEEKRLAILDRWLTQILPTDPKKNPFPQVRKQKNQFANPLGHKYNVGTRAVVDALVDGEEPAVIRGPLTEMIKLRSVQDLTAAKAVSFVFELKDVISVELKRELKDGALRAELIELFGRVDQVGLLAFDIFSECREQLFDVRVHEVLRQVSGLVRRAERLDSRLHELDEAKERGSS